MRMRCGTWFVLAVTLLGLCGLACGGAKDALTEKVSETVAEKVTEKALEATTGTSQVDFAADGGAVDISAMPEWLRYPGATGKAHVASAPDATSGGGDMWMMQTADPLPAVKAWYQKALSTWQQQVATETAEAVLFVAQSPSGDASVSVTISKETDGPTTVTIMHSKTAPG